MKHNIIATKDYLLIVNESEIGGENDYFYLGKKIIAHLPLNGSPILEGVDLLPPIENEAEELAKEKYPIHMQPNGRTLAGGHYDVDVNFMERRAYVKGFNKATEKYKWTDQDMIEFAIWRSITVFDLPYTPAGEFRMWESLQKSKMPVGFECEEVIYSVENDSPLKEMKTMLNPDGQTQWVGKYIYNK